MQYELTLCGFDGSTDKTDHLIIWVEADMSLHELKTLLAANGLAIPGKIIADVAELDVSNAHAEFDLPAELADLAAHAAKLVNLYAAGETAYACEECHFVGNIDALHSIDKIHERVLPGEFMAAGQCPECGCLIGIADSDIPDYTLEQAAKILGKHGWTVRAPHQALMADKALTIAQAFAAEPPSLDAPNLQQRLVKAGLYHVMDEANMRHQHADQFVPHTVICFMFEDGSRLVKFHSYTNPQAPSEWASIPGETTPY